MCTTKKYLLNLKNWLNIDNNKNNIFPQKNKKIKKRFDMGDKAVASHKTLFGSLLTYISVLITQSAISYLIF